MSLRTCRCGSANGAPIDPDTDLPYTSNLPQVENTYTITNEVTCTAELTLVKEVRNGSADPTEWNLDSDAPAGALPGPAGVTGTPQTTDVAVTPDARYVLTESGETRTTSRWTSTTSSPRGRGDAYRSP